uniref:Uncharacterized protein n=1 Tax=Anopheles maculatus TaxID=74869 RepID=A0A182T1D9_9DIPT
MIVSMESLKKLEVELCHKQHHGRHLEKVLQQGISHHECLDRSDAEQTTSHDATCVVASTIPLVLLIEEDIRCHAEKAVRGGSAPDIRGRQLEETMRRWQQQWTVGAEQQRSPGLKTRRLIPDIMSWVSPRQGEIDFHLTQRLTGYEFLRNFFVDKVMFHCLRFARAQHEMQKQGHNRLTMNDHGRTDRSSSSGKGGTKQQ